MPLFTIEVLDSATIYIKATVEVEAETYEEAVERLDTATIDDPLYDLDFEADVGLGWWDQHNEREYRCMSMDLGE